MKNKFSRKQCEQQLWNYPRSLWKHLKQIQNHIKREKKGLEPKRFTLSNK